MPSSLPVCSSYARGNDALTCDPTQIFPRQGSLAERCADLNGAAKGDYSICAAGMSA